MATLTGQRIKDTYDAVLKLEDNAALTSSPKAITDGLGNNTPISVSTIKVDVSSDLEASSFVKTSGLSTQFLKADGSVDSSAYLTSGDLPASHWSSNLVGIDYAGGNVGIGTTSPTKLLEVKSSSAYDSTVRLSTIAHNWDIQGGESGYSSTSFALDYDGTTFFRAMGATDARFSGGLSVGTINPTPPTGGLYVAGNVGIGTTSPSAALEVVGGIKLSDNSPLTWATSNTRIFGQVGYMQFQVGSTDKMRITSAGNVGIGTTAPSTPLHINADAPTIRLQDATSGDNHYLTGNNGELRVQSSGYITMRPGATVSTTFLANGNVGIGTTSPSAKLQIDSTSGWGVFTERGIKDGSTSTYSHNYGAGNAHILGRAMYFENAAVFSTSTADSTTKEYRFSNASDKLTVKSLVSGVTVDNNILVLSGSNVGIGTASPLNKLQVSDGSVGIDSQYMIRDNRNNTILHQSANTAASNRSLTIGNATYSNVIIPNGNVGIGTTSPDYPLHVDATIKIGDRQGTDGSLILQSQQGPNITFKSTGDVLDISGTTGATNGNSIRLSDNIKKLYFNGGIGGTIAINRGNRGLMDSNVGGLEVQQQDIAGSNGKSTFLSTSSLGTILRSTSYGSIGTSGDIQFQFGGGANTSEPSPTTKMIIKNSGNVGIGTTSPSRTLSVKSSSSSMVADFRSASGNNSFVSFSNNASTADQVRLGSTSGNLVLSTNYTERIRIDASGNVGIGTTSPLSRLHVVSREINNGANKGIRIENYNGTKDYSIRTGVSGIENTSLAFYDETAGANRIVITSAGNVGIGTDSPSEKLEVDGQVLSDGYRLAAMQTAPATRNSTGTLGEIVIDGNYIYVCYAASSWSRVALETSW